MIEELTVHAWIEEEIFHPAARAAVPDTTDHVLESVEEHHVVLRMLSELAGPDPEDERFDAKMTVLVENVRHHVEEEEKEWFPKVRSALGHSRLGELGERLAAAEPDSPHDPGCPARTNDLHGAARQPGLRSSRSTGRHSAAPASAGITSSGVQCSPPPATTAPTISGASAKPMLPPVANTAIAPWLPRLASRATRADSGW